METERICKGCGAALPAEAPEGLCPKCLLKAGIRTQPAGQPGSAAGSGAPEEPLPDPARLAEYFPQLEILELLGQGGMGAVYKARQPALDRLVALKILPARAAADAGFTERFIREARALAKLSHPNIVAVYDFGQTHGLHYFLMEYVDGPNLRQIEQTGKLSARQALQIIPQVCEALQYAHDEGVVHRDIKPENVLLDKKGRVKIADFGLAKILGLENQTLRLTGAKDFMGTPHYMAPEQVENPRQVDHRADIYSLGVVFYEMLTGELPLGRFAPPSQKVQVDVRLDEVVLHALEKEPQRRYQHASEVKTDVESITNRPAPAPAPPAPVPSAAPAPAAPPRREFWKTAVGILAIVITVILAGSVLMIGLAVVLPAIFKARQAAAGQPNLLVTGTVTDAVTGQAITGARVSDNRYGAGPGSAPLETWTDSSGRYQLTTWDEEHTMAASAPGYDPGLATLLTKPFGPTGHAQLNFRLQPTSSMRKLNEALAQLAKLRQQYTEDHPLIQAKLGQVRELRSQIPAASETPVAPPGLPVPPGVIQTLPESGSSDVDPDLTELQVTFSTTMKDGSWSWTTWGEENFPEVTGPIHYATDRRTCVLPVSLKPNKVYATWINSEQFQNFQDLDGHPAVPYLLIFKTGPK